MRPFLSAILFVGLVSGCRCSPPNPQAVTLRVVNSTRAPIYVDDTSGKLGLTVQREVGGEYFGFDDLSCPCRFCTNVCDLSCSCPAVSDQIRRVDPGSSVERTWDGVIQTSGFTSCDPNGCLDQVNAPLNEAFQLQLCFSAQTPTGARFDDGGVAAGTLPMVSTECTTKSFAPQDLEVEIGPARGAACTTTADCRGTDELCFDGACTTGCPANDIPSFGAQWSLTVASPDNMGFFERSARGAQQNVYSGTGTLTSAQYASGTLQLRFSRPGLTPGENLTGGVQIGFPVGTGAPISSGGQVKVTLIDDGEAQPTRAFVMRDAATNDILLAADTAAKGNLLDDTDLLPFSVTTGSTPVGCAMDACGRFLYAARLFASGGASVQIVPGQTKNLSVGVGTWAFLDVTSGTYQHTSCDVTSPGPYAFWKVTTP